MSITEIKNQLQIIYKLLQLNNNEEAKHLFITLEIVDSDIHLRLPFSFRHFIWDLNEYFLVGNINYISKEEILEEYKNLFNPDN
jgi:threonine synthase